MTHPALPDSGIVRIRCKHSAAVTLKRLQSLLQDCGISVFARINFSGDAQRAGLSMPAQQLLLFGNPKAGTPLMLNANLQAPVPFLLRAAGD